MQDVTKQVKAPIWLGALQVQITNSLFYMNLISMGMMVMTFWYTAGYQIKDRYMPWLSIWEFIGAVIVVLLIVMYLDYRYVYPSRQAFLNEQSCKHENPAMVKLIELELSMNKVKKHLGIED